VVSTRISHSVIRSRKFITCDDRERSHVESCKANKVNSLTYLTYILANARNKALRLPTPDEFATLSTAQPAGALFSNLGYDHALRKMRISGSVRVNAFRPLFKVESR